jgi:hypothetical protein
MVPIPTKENKILAGKPVHGEQLAFLTTKRTTKKEVIERLGSPSIIWEDARVLAYSWEMRQGILFWAAGTYYSGAAGMKDIPKHYLLLIRFDEKDRVQRFSRTVRPLTQSYSDFLKEWLKNSNAQSPLDPHELMEHP